MTVRFSSCRGCPLPCRCLAALLDASSSCAQHPHPPPANSARKFVGERGWEGRWCRQQPTPSWHLDRLDSEVSLARSGNAVSRKWRKSRRKRDRRVRSKSRPDVSGRGASNAPSAFYPNSSLRGLTVCVPGGERPRRPPPGNPRSRQAGDWLLGPASHPGPGWRGLRGSCSSLCGVRGWQGSVPN